MLSFLCLIVQLFFAVVSAGTLYTAGLLAINHRVLVHEPLLSGRALYFVYSMQWRNMHELHAYTASRSVGVTLFDCFDLNMSSTLFVSHGCVNLLSCLFFLRDAKLHRFVNAC